MNKQKISLESIVVQADGSIVSNMDGEKVMMSIINGKYYSLGEVGSVIWDLIELPVSVNELIARLIEDYDVEKEECKDQVLSFLESLTEENIIHFEEKVTL